jgi:hypothetical protein
MSGTSLDAVAKHLNRMMELPESRVKGGLDL